MISSISADFHFASAANVSQITAEQQGEIENDGDSDDGSTVAQTGGAMRNMLPDYLGRAINVLA